MLREQQSARKRKVKTGGNQRKTEEGKRWAKVQIDGYNTNLARALKHRAVAWGHGEKKK